jgi:hypothetical protein
MAVEATAAPAVASLASVMHLHAIILFRTLSEAGQGGSAVVASAHVRGRLTLSFCVRHNCSINCSCKMLPGCLADKGSVDQHRAGGGSHDRMGTPGTPRWKGLCCLLCQREVAYMSAEFIAHELLIY